MNVRNQAIHRTERLTGGDYNDNDTPRRRPYHRDPAAFRPAGAPVLSMADTLRREVEHAESRLETAREQLRRYLLSHGSDETPDVGRHATNGSEVV